MAYRRKFLFGFWPFWPTYRVGHKLMVMVREIAPVVRGEVGQCYFLQHWQEAPDKRVVGVLGQVPLALAGALADEAINIWRSRLNNRTA